MPLIQTQHHCPTCNAPRLFTKDGTNHLVHALVTLFLCGMWIPIWVLATISNNLTPGRCAVCGSTPRGGGVGVVGVVVAVICTVVIGIVVLGGGLGMFLSSKSVPRNETTTDKNVSPEAILRTEEIRRAEVQADAIKAASEKKKADMAAATLKFHQELADKGDPYGWLAMGKRYLAGDGVEKDEVEAVRLLKMASKGGQEEATQLLEKLTSLGLGK
jgi:hypothetical protein